MHLKIIGIMKLILAFFLIITQIGFAQQEKSINHKVVKGETIYQISKKYNVTPDEIFKINPDAKNGVQENNILIIPNSNSFSYNIKKNEIPVNKLVTSHVVQPKETLYGISKLYNVTVNDLEKENDFIIKEGIKPGQTLQIPAKSTLNQEEKLIEKIVSTTETNQHIVKPKETLFSIARLYNVSVNDLDKLNSKILEDGLQISEVITIPNKKKTLNGQARIITNETLFHIVEAKETKFSISKKYNISIAQLELQNPEIINGLIIGNKLAINAKLLEPKNDKEELMIALAEKQVAVEKNKSKVLEIEDLQDKLTVQRQMNQKILKVNSLKVNLNAIDETKGGSAEKLKLVLEANKNIQEILISKLDSLVVTMSDDLVVLKDKEIDNLEASKKLEKESSNSMGETNKILFQLKKDLADNRKIYTGLMNKVQQISYDENHEYKKKVNQNYKQKKLNETDKEAVEAIKKIQKSQEINDKKNEFLLSKIDSLGNEKKAELTRRISKATFYSAEARDFDDKLAQAKLKRYQKNALINNENPPERAKNLDKTYTEIVVNKDLSEIKKTIKIEVLKNIEAVKNGYYIVAKTFTEAKDRDEFTLKLTDSGEINTNFFFNINIFTYYVYSKIYQNIDEALLECKEKKGNPLFENMFIVQIENN